jgi:cytochrome c oxidase subunit 3
MFKQKTINTQRHPYHLVDPSPWPFVASIGLFFLTFGSVMFFHNMTGNALLLTTGIITILYVMFTWWRDIVREGTYEGQHTKQVQLGLKSGMLLFIASEVMFFFAFFWAFFHSSLAPTVELGSLWPPQEIITLSAWEVPLLNTIILLTSGATVTWAHHAIVYGSRTNAIVSLILTILFATFFTSLQVFEYCETLFNISDSVYGSIFFMATGFHGAHVLIGTIFLLVCTIRLIRHHFTKQHHFGFEAAAWYWHFVDVVWLFLFITIYWWGGQ